jgi:hypothetical protein
LLDITINSGEDSGMKLSTDEETGVVGLDKY